MYRAIRKNKINSVLIMALFVLIIGGLGVLAGYIYQSWTITIVVVVISILYAILQYFLASRQAMSLAGGVEITEADNPRLYRIVENLAITDGLPMPRVFVIHDPAPNAFATGRKPENALVAATTGLLDMMTDPELEGVMAHELGHVKNYDIRVNMIVYGLVVAIGMLADLLLRMTIFGRNRNSNPIFLVVGLAAMIVAPLIATVVQLAVSRQREYLADATGALTTRHPDALASALHKLSQYSGQPMQRQQSSMAHMWFANPMKPGGLKKLFSTHPPIEDRIRRLIDSGTHF